MITLPIPITIAECTVIALAPKLDFRVRTVINAMKRKSGRNAYSTPVSVTSRLGKKRFLWF